MQDSLVERYLRLGLQLDRHVEDTVDAYFGPPEIAAEVKAAAPVEPRELVAAAEALVDELDDSWLRDQVVGLRTYAGVLAGEAISYADEAEGCYRVRPTHTDESAFEAAHERLEELLPGQGTLAERHARWEESIRVPAELIGPTIATVIEEARSWTRGIVDLPDGEGIDLEIVHDVPWMGFCQYLGNLRSRISINVDLPKSAFGLLRIAIHETYPGHHVERCCKEDVLVRGRGLLEESISLVPTPQSLVSEGIAGLAPFLLLESEAGPALAGVLHDAGIELDLAHALEIERAIDPCRWADVNASLMLHDAGAGEDEVRAYLERWGLLSPEISAHVIRFLREPTSRSYMVTYPAGKDLCRSYLAAVPDGFRRLLTEQLRVGDLRAA